jgi:hypothetical protein
MKNQYFGDRRDYFKYDVLERLATDLDEVRQLTCLWMLTPPDGSGQGQVPFVPDPELPELTEFFRTRLISGDPGQTRVSAMGAYFSGRPFAFFSYRVDREDFATTTRARYFASVPEEALQRAVVFFDPDNGLEPGRTTEKHLRFEELAGVLGRMDACSVAVVFQYWRRVRDFWAVMANELVDRLHRPLAYIADPTLAFYVLASSADRRDEVREVLERIATRHTPGVPNHRLVASADDVSLGARRDGVNASTGMNNRADLGLPSG